MQETINKAYQIFGKYQAHMPLNVCTDCCMNKEKAELLARMPVKEIPLKLLMQYTDGASLSEKTPVDEVKHFLPRYLDLVSRDQFPSHSPEITFRRLAPFNSSDWTLVELGVLENFATEYFSNYLSTFPNFGRVPIDSILIMFWRGQFRMTDLLESWLNHDSLQGTLHFIYAYQEGFQWLGSDKMKNPFADDQISNLLHAWIHSPKVKDVFRRKVQHLLRNTSALDQSQLEELNLFYELLE